jgi:hypothetical protein
MSALSDYLAGITPDSPYIENNNSDDNSWKYISAGDIRGLNDYTDRTYNYRHIPFLGQLGGHIADAATQVVADTSQYLNMPKLGNYLNEAAQQGEDYLPPMSTPEMSLAYLTDPNGLTSAFGQGVGSMLPGAAFAGVLPTAGLAAKVSDMVSQTPKAGGLLSGLAKGGIRWAPTAIPEAMSEAGNTERTMLQDGASSGNAQAAANQVFAGNAKLLAGTNFLEGGLLSGLHVKIPKVSDNGILNGLAQAGGYIPSTLAETALQGFEEGEQQGIQNSAEGKAYSYNPAQWTADQTEQAKFGVAASLPMIGGFAGARALSRRFGNKALPEDIQQIIDDANNETQQTSMDNSQSTDNNPNEATQGAQQQDGQKSYNITDEVSDTGLASSTEKKLNNLSSAFEEKFGEPLNVTSMRRHGDGSSWHDSGQAFDVAGGLVEDNPDARQWLMDNATDYGLTPLDEYANPSANATGGHIHFSDHDSSDESQDNGGIADKEGGDIAEVISQKTGLPADWVWAQMYHETGGFSSDLAKEDHNYAGVKNEDGSYRHFDSDEDFADYQARNLEAYREDGLFDAKNVDEFAAALKDGGYFSANLAEYQNGMKHALNGTGSTRSRSSSTNNLSAGDDKVFSDKIIDFADHMRATSEDPSTINFFEDKFNSRNKFIDTPENRQEIENQYGDQLKNYIDKQQAPQQSQPDNTNTLSQSAVDATTNTDRPQPAQPNTAPKPVTIPQKTAQIEIQTPNLDKAKQAAQEQQATSAMPQPSEAAINNPAIATTSKLADNMQSQPAQQEKTSQPTPNMGQKKGADINENIKSAGTEATENSNAEDKNADTVSEQSNPAAEESKINPVRNAYVEDNGSTLHGGIKNGTMTIWEKSMPKAEMPINISADEIRTAVSKHDTPEDGLRALAKEKLFQANDKWIRNTPDLALKNKRQQLWENDPNIGKDSAGTKQAVDSVARVAKTLWEKSTGKKLDALLAKKTPAGGKSHKGIHDNIEEYMGDFRKEAAPTERIKDYGNLRMNSNFFDDGHFMSAHDAMHKAVHDEMKAETFDINNKTFHRLTDKNGHTYSLSQLEYDYFKFLGGKESTATSPSTKETSRFGDEQEATDNLMRAFGIQKPKEKTFHVLDDSDEALQAALHDFDKEMKKISANPFFNPKLFKSAIQVGMIHLQRGLNNFADWTKAMLKTSPQLKPFLPSVWDAINAYPKNIKFDEEKMSAVLQYIGTQYDKGITDKATLKAQLAKIVGQEYAGLIEPAYAGVVKYPTREELSNELNDSTSPVAERNSTGANKNTVGQNDASQESRGERGRSVQPSAETEASTRGSGSVHGHSTDTGRATGDSAVRTEKSSDSDNSTGAEQLSRGVVTNYEGQALLDNGRTGHDIKSAQNGRNDAANLSAVKENTDRKEAGELENIKHDLPMLLPEQIRDVRFAEKRLLENEGPGVLFTNGTGTGKTFTGLGIVKRFIYKGKSNILIVTPSAKINSDWIDTAKKFFHLKLTALDDTKDAGRGPVVTTYANMGANNALVNRKWDLVIPDESHSLMSGENGNPTDALKNLRAITMNPRGFIDRFHRLHAKEYEKIASMPDGTKKDAAYNKLHEQQQKDIAIWTEAAEHEKAKVTFLSATPWAYVPDIDYAEGYLFQYPKSDGSRYNSGDGKAKFYISNFGYRMRYNKLTKPEASVDSSVMEVQFHQKLRDAGVLSGRALTVDKDYDRGFILVDGGIGKKIDEGFEWLSKKEHGLTDLSQFLQQQYKGNQKDYLLEAVKAKEAIPLINAYLKSGKKVVVFHGYKKGGAKHPFRIENIPNDLKEQYANFAQMRPDLVGLNLKELHSPIATLQQEYGNKLALFNGDVSKQDREQAVKDFNNDRSDKNIILVQQDAGQAGISLHDTTGKHQRVLINLGMPTKPVAAIQIEGRIYRVGQQSNAIFRYLNTGTLMEKNAFANKIAERASTAENLALGEQARDLKNSFVDAFEETMDSDEWKKNLPGTKGEGTGGKERDQASRNALTEFDKAKTYYFAQQKKNSHTKAAEGKDYFATPEPLGYKMTEWANLKPGDSVLEPSAGHGAIARFFPSDTKNVAIEPSTELAPRVKMAMNGGEVLTHSFENYYVGNKFNAVVMNPPFGSGGKTAIDHVAKAFRHLKDGGRLVAVIPDGPSANKHLEKWLYGNETAENKQERAGEPDAMLIKTISLPDVTFERAGTKVKTKVIIIDKQETAAGKEAASQYQSGQYDVTANNINQLFDNIEHITAPAYETSSKQEQTMQTGEGSNFTTGTHENTKTGEEQEKAAFKDRVNKDTYRAINSAAKRHAGYYSRFAKAFLFDDTESRDAFVKEADALLASNVKASARNLGERLRANIELVPDKELPGREQALQTFGKALGVDTVFFKGHKMLNGFYHNGVSFINMQSNLPNSWIFWHEAFHWMEKNNVPLFNDMVDYIASKEGFSDVQLNEYRDEIGRPEMTDIETIEEMMADYMPDVRRRVSLFQNLGKENKSLAERFVAWVHDLMDRFTEFMNTPAAGLTNTQKQSMRETFAKLACSMVDEDGKKIFARSRDGLQSINGHVMSQEGNAVAYSRNESIKYSLQKQEMAKQDKSFIDMPFKKLLSRFHSTPSPQIQIDTPLQSKDQIGSMGKVLASPSYIAQRVKSFKMFYEYATRGMNKLTKLRSDFSRKYGAAMDLVKNKSDRAALYEIMLQGDTEAKEWTKQELLDEGTKENVAEAYIRVRRIINVAYRLLNDARRRPQNKSATLNKVQLENLKNNHFVEVLKTTEKDAGNYLVTYKEYANWKKTYAVNADELKHMKADDAIQILKETHVGNNAYEIEVREGIPDLNKIAGYVPHFFHEFFVMQKGKDGHMAIVDSGRTMKEAVRKAEIYLKKHPNIQLVVRPKQFDFAQVGINQKDDMRYAATIGDKEYKRVMYRMATENDISLAEAKEMMQGKLKLKNRHRFYGNFIQRKGAAGYEKDLDWVMRHFFNTSSRYVAMETEFKPKAISLFERLYGRFDDAHSDNPTARYTKDYINDINGNPTAVEMWLNDLLNNSKFWRNHVVANFGDRAALQLVTPLTNTISIMKLGCFNISSAMINLSQLVNSAALIGDVNVLWKALARGAHKKYSIHDLKILTESGVLNDIGLDSGAGYGKMSVGNLANKSMFFFKQSEGLVRRGTVLAAYEKAIENGMNHDKAIEYAQQVNRKANFDYGVNDAPNIFRRGSVFSQILLQFKKYPIKEFELMAEMVSKDTTPKQKAIFWGSYFLMAGLFQVPALDWFDDLGEAIFGRSYKNKVKQAIYRAAGDNPMMKALAKIAVYGIFSTANVDISSRAGVGDAIPSIPKDFRSFVNLLGPLASSIIQPFLYAKDGDTMQALKMLSPGIANIIMAVSGKNEGSRGRTNAVYDSGYDRLLRVLGFKSVDESIATDKQSIIYDDNKQLQKEKQNAVDDFIGDPSPENLARLKELGVKPQTVKNERKRKQEDKSARMKDSMPKKQQKEDSDFLSF